MGIARISLSFPWGESDITVAFCGAPDVPWLRLPAHTSCLLEAITPCQFTVQPDQLCPQSQDLIGQWLLDLHLVRHPVGAEARLAALLRLLVSHFGIRRSDGYLLPFVLSHGRLAELIAATRSTVTRQITLLRQRGDLQLEEGEMGMLFSSGFVEAP